MKKLIKYKIKLIKRTNVDNKKCAEYYIREYKGMIECIKDNVKERKVPFLEFELVGGGGEYQPAFEVEAEDIIKFLNGLIKECEEVING